MSATGVRVVITQSPVLKAASSRKNACREGSRTRPSSGPGGFWSGSSPSRTNRVRRCATSFASLSPFFHAVPIRGSGSPNQVRATSRNSSADEVSPTAALSVEGPTKNELRRTIMFSSHPSEPMVDERGLSDPSPGDDCNDVDILVCPCTIQKSDILLSTKHIASGNRQSGYGNLLRCKSCWWLASSDTRSGRGRLLQALTSDSTPCVDCACYRRHRLQQLVRSLETLCRIFLKE